MHSDTYIRYDQQKKKTVGVMGYRRREKRREEKRREEKRREEKRREEKRREEKRRESISSIFFLTKINRHILYMYLY